MEILEKQDDRLRKVNNEMVVAKVKCEQKTIYPGDRAEVILKPVTIGSKENEEFYSYTPAGSVILTVISPKTAAQFVPGKEYYMEFLEAEN